MNDKNVTALIGQEISHLLHISQGYQCNKCDIALHFGL